jgi:hypothetical protein
MATSVVRVDNKKFETKQVELRRMVDSIIVRDAQTCGEAKRAQKDIRDELKQRHFVLDPFVVQAKSNYDDAKEERSKWIDPLESLDGALAIKVKAWEREEREKAEQEQRREQERLRIETEKKAAEERKAREKEIAEQRKAGELKAAEAKRLLKLAEEEEKKAAANVPTIEVKPNIPSQAGVPSRINYKSEVTHPERIINAYVDAVSLRNTERAVYLRQFVMVNEQAIGAEARKVKNSKQMAELIPGVRFFED